MTQVKVSLRFVCEVLSFDVSQSSLLFTAFAGNFALFQFVPIRNVTTTLERLLTSANYVKSNSTLSAGSEEGANYFQNPWQRDDNRVASFCPVIRKVSATISLNFNPLLSRMSKITRRSFLARTRYITRYYEAKAEELGDERANYYTPPLCFACYRFECYPSARK